MSLRGYQAFELITSVHSTVSINILTEISYIMTA